MNDGDRFFLAFMWLANLAFTFLNLKIYTEIMKEKSQRERTK